MLKGRKQGRRKKNDGKGGRKIAVSFLEREQLFLASLLSSSSSPSPPDSEYDDMRHHKNFVELLPGKKEKKKGRKSRATTRKRIRCFGAKREGEGLVKAFDPFSSSFFLSLPLPLTRF